MAEIEFNDKGVPLMAYGKSYFAVTSGAPKTDPLKVSKKIEKISDTVSVAGYKISSWGANNDFPVVALEQIGKTGVLNTGLRFLRNLTLGQGVFPVRVTGFDDKGNEQLEVVNNSDLTRFLGGRTIRRYMANAFRDYLKFGIAFPELLPNADGSKIVGINTINARHCRLTEATNAGLIENCIVSGEWPDTPAEGKWSAISVLDTYDPGFDLLRYKLLNKAGGKSFIYPLRDEWANEDYYPAPIWYSAYKAGWTAVANKVPAFLEKAFENQITWLWHIKIPYAYWDKMYPENQFTTPEARKTAIQLEMDKI